MTEIKDRLYKVRGKVTNWKFVAFCAIMVLLYFGHQNILDWALIPSFNYLHALPLIGGGIDWLLLYGGVGTWNWHTISACFILAVVAVAFGYWWGRSSIEIIEVNPTSKTTAEPQPKPELTPEQKKIQELTEQIAKLKQPEKAES